jgi:hypothetical protein
MPISPEQYTDMKEYWDYQRKVEYNREQIEKMAMEFESRMYSDSDAISIEEFKSKLWSKIDTADYDDPPKNWVPKNEYYRFWNEEYPPKTLLTKPGRPVVLRAKNENSDI